MSEWVQRGIRLGRCASSRCALHLLRAGDQPCTCNPGLPLKCAFRTCMMPPGNRLANRQLRGRDARLGVRIAPTLGGAAQGWASSSIRRLRSSLLHRGHGQIERMLSSDHLQFFRLTSRRQSAVRQPSVITPTTIAGRRSRFIPVPSKSNRTSRSDAQHSQEADEPAVHEKTSAARGPGARADTERQHQRRSKERRRARCSGITSWGSARAAIPEHRVTKKAQFQTITRTDVVAEPHKGAGASPGTPQAR